jgi:hypothetical protein
VSAPPGRNVRVLNMRREQQVVNLRLTEICVGKNDSLTGSKIERQTVVGDSYWRGKIPTR